MAKRVLKGGHTQKKKKAGGAPKSEKGLYWEGLPEEEPKGDHKGRELG